MDNRDQHYMELALLEAQKAYEKGEVPIGAILVQDQKIIGRGHNLREELQDPTAHAEIIAIKEGAQKLASWRLTDCTLYVTLEPCPMCAGAILQGRLKRLVYGASDPKGGAVESLLELFELEGFNHKVEVTAGLLAERSSQLLQEFFRRLRQGRVSESG